MLTRLLMAAGSLLQPGTPGRGSLKASAAQLKGQGLRFCGLRVRMSIASGVAEACHTNAQVGAESGGLNVGCEGKPGGFSSESDSNRCTD